MSKHKVVALATIRRTKTSGEVLSGGKVRRPVTQDIKPGTIFLLSEEEYKTFGAMDPPVFRDYVEPTTADLSTSEPDDGKSEERAALEARATELGVSFRRNAADDTLRARIAEAEGAAEPPAEGDDDIL